MHIGITAEILRIQYSDGNSDIVACALFTSGVHTALWMLYAWHRRGEHVAYIRCMLGSHATYAWYSFCIRAVFVVLEWLAREVREAYISVVFALTAPLG